jgi:hypothetical protein
MQLNSQTSSFILRERFVQQIRHKSNHKWIAVPVDVISFYSPKAENYPDLFSAPLLKLIQTQIASITELSRLTGLSRDLVLYILEKELSSEVEIRGDYVEMKGESARPLPSLNVRELSEYYIFRLPVTGALLPRPVNSKEPFWSTPDFFTPQGFPLFEFGSKGRPFRVGPFLLPAVSGKDARSLSDREVREAIDQYNNDYSAAMDFFGAEKVREDATKMVALIRTIENVRVMHEAHLITAVIGDNSETDYWSCADPFGVFQNRGLIELKAEVEAICAQSEQAKKVLNDVQTQLIGITTNTSKYQHAASEIDSRFPALPSEILRHVLITFAVKYADLDDANEREREVYEGIWSQMQISLETLFQHYWQGDGLRKKTKIFTAKDKTNRDRGDHLNLLLSDYCGSTDSDLSGKLSDKNIWKFAYSQKTSLKSLLLGMMLQAEDNKGHILRDALRQNENIIGTVVDIANFRNKRGGHASGKTGLLSPAEKEELTEYVEKTYRIVEAFTAKKEDPKDGKEK